MKNKHSQIITFLIFLFSTQVNAQLDSLQSKKIDSLFIDWNVPNYPGGAVAVMKDGKTVFSKAYGLASLEYLVPNSTGTIFNTGSVSKQFTAMGIVRLEEQGKLAFDDDIHKYFPELPDFGESITIRHLLHHTSGLRSLHALFSLAGWRSDDSRTNEDLNRIILNQKDLNFKPGSEFLYCNTGYMLMVNIIENITKEKFKDWMKKNIFDELEMDQTYVEDLYSRVVANNATSYYGRNNFKRAVEYWGYVGSGNMHSTTSDLLKWLQNFNSAQVGWEAAFEKLQTVDLLNNGEINNYGFGVIVDSHLGKKRIQHGGSIGGFRAFAGTYPAENLSIVVLTNFSGGNPGGKSNQIAEILLEKRKAEESQEIANEIIRLSNEALSKFEGTYWNDKKKDSRKIYLKNDTLRFSISENYEILIVPIKKNVFKMLNVSANVVVNFKSKNQMTVDGLSLSVFDRVESEEVVDNELSQYVGKYYSTEVETTYIISVKGDQLSIYHPRHGIMTVKWLFQDVLYCDWPIGGTIQIKRNNAKQVSGILISNGRVRNAWFEKQ